MLTDEEIDLSRRQYETMTPAKREAFKREVIRRAHAERDAVMRTIFGLIWVMLPNPTRVSQKGIAALHSLWTAYLENRKRKIAVSELLSLDDRMLKDMGLSRSEIVAVVHAENSSRLPPSMTSRKGRDKVNACVSQSLARAPQASISAI